MAQRSVLRCLATLVAAVAMLGGPGATVASATIYTWDNADGGGLLPTAVRWTPAAGVPTERPLADKPPVPPEYHWTAVHPVATERTAEGGCATGFPVSPSPAPIRGGTLNLGGATAGRDTSLSPAAFSRNPVNIGSSSALPSTKSVTAATSYALTGSQPQATTQASNIVHVFLFNGQSNMSGYNVTSADLTAAGYGWLNTAQSATGDSVKVSLLKSSTNIDTSFYWLRPGAPDSDYGPGFGPDLKFGYNVGQKYSGQTVYFIKEAQSGTDLVSQWKPGTGTDSLTSPGGSWNTFMIDTKAALQALVNAGKTPEIDGFFWIQGEYDANKTQAIADAYETNLKNLMTAVRSSASLSQYMVADMPFIIGTPSWSTSNWSHISTVIAAQKDLSVKWLNTDGSVTTNTSTSAAANTYYVDFTDLALQPDGQHYLAASYVTMGDRFYTMYDLTQALPPSNYWQGAPGANWTATASWVSGVPNAQGAVANFVENIGGAAVNVNQGVTVGTIAFLTSAGAGSLSYTISSGSGSVITMDNSTSGGIAAITLSTSSSAQTISAAIRLASDLTVVNSSSNALTLSGNLSETGGSRALTLTAGLLVLGGTNSYTGNTTISGGTLRMGGVNAAAPGSTVALSAGATLDIASSSQVIGGLSGAGGTVTSTGSPVLTIRQNTDTTFSGRLTGGMALVKSGSGALTLSTTAGYTGTTTVNGGTLRFGASNVVPTGSRITVNSGATLDLGAYTLNRTNTSLTLSGGTLTGSSGSLLAWTEAQDGAGVTATGVSAITVPTIDVASGSTFQHYIIATGPSDQLFITSSLTGSTYDQKFGGSGTIYLSGSSNYTVGGGGAVPTEIGAGGATNATTVVARSSSALGVSTSLVRVNSGATLAFQDSTGSGVNLANPIQVTGAGVGASGALRGLAGVGSGNNSNTASGTITLNAATTAGVDAGATLTLSGQVTGAFALTKVGGGTLLLAGATSNYTGATTVRTGTLAIGANAPSGGAGSLGNATSAVILGTSGTGTDTVGFLINGAYTMGRTLTAANYGAGTTIGGSNSTGTAIYATGSTIALGKSVNLTAADGGTVDFRGAISGASYGITKIGGGTVILSATNTYGGPTTVAEGVLNVRSSGALLNTSDVQIFGGAVLQIQGDIATGSGQLTLGGGSLGGSSVLENVSGNNTWMGGVSVNAPATVQVDSGMLTLANGLRIESPASVTKTGTGTLTIGASAMTSYGSGSLLVLSGGTTNLNAVGGDNTHRNLAVTVDHATLAAGDTQYLASLAMTNSARASLSAVGTGVQSRTIKTDALAIDGTSLLDLGDNNLVINYTNDQTGNQLQAVINMIKLGGGTKSDAAHYDWNGTRGITSSSITGNSGTTYTNMNLALGIRDLGFNLVNRAAPASVEGVTVESGTAVGGTASIVVMYTWIGDTDLDGKVTVNDYLEFLQYYAEQPSANYVSWMTGDFNYDGLINVNDYLLLLAGYANQGSPLAGNEEITDTMQQAGLDLVTTPEPTTLLLLAAGAGLALGRRRRRS